MAGSPIKLTDDAGRVRFEGLQQGGGGGSIPFTEITVPTSEADWIVEHGGEEGDAWSFADGVISHTVANVPDFQSGFLGSVAGGYSGPLVMEAEVRFPSAGQDGSLFPEFVMGALTELIQGTGQGGGVNFSGASDYTTNPQDFTVSVNVDGNTTQPLGTVEGVALDTWVKVRFLYWAKVSVWVNDVLIGNGSPGNAPAAPPPNDKLYLQANGLADIRNLRLWQLSLPLPT